jgi:hypothetical protein
VAEICGKLAAEYRVAPETCQEQVVEFVQDLAEVGLLDV